MNCAHTCRIDPSSWVLVCLAATALAALAVSPASGEIGGPRAPSITVTAPNGGESWGASTSHAITWSAVDVTGNVNIALFKGGGKVRTLQYGIPAGDGTWTWDIPNGETPGTDYQIKVISASAPSVSDLSDGTFTITAAPITLTAPNGGESWEAGRLHTVTWTTNGLTGDVKIWLFKGGVKVRVLRWTEPASAGSWIWYIPGDETLGDDYQIKVVSKSDSSKFDFSDANFSITAALLTLTAPNGGEAWPAATFKTVTWDAPGVTGDVKIWLFKGWVKTRVLSWKVPASAGTWTWYIPGDETLGDDYRLKVVSKLDSGICDFSDADFSITAPPLTVTSPNGGESWGTGTSEAITWTSSGLTGDVKILLFKGGAKVRVLQYSVPVATGTWSWDIPLAEPLGSDYTIKMVSLADPDVVDYSDDDFTIEAGTFDFTSATVVVRSGVLPNAEETAATVLIEEVDARTGVTWTESTSWPSTGNLVVITSGPADPGWGHSVPTRTGADLPEDEPDGYRLLMEEGNPGSKTVWVIGGDARGALYGVGKFLRTMEWATSSLTFPALDFGVAPEQPLRGHEIGYRALANSYDAWDVAQYEQYIREMIIFGANAIENIPFDTKSSPHFPITKAQMAIELSTLCDNYDIEYWVWTPVDMNDPTARAQALVDHEAFYAACPRLDAVFFPAGDPGHNPPSVMMPFVDQIAPILATYHPDAGVWIGNETLTHAELDDFFDYLQTEEPTSVRGVVYGPWTKITLAEMRTRTPSQYPVRRYPDITHSIECQYPVPSRSRALAYTLGRENPNPRPTDMALIHNVFRDLADGFVAYSDGAHDDVNKMVWLMSGVDSTISVDTILEDYCRFFFGPTVAQDAADGIAGLEQNEAGDLAANTGVETTFDAWQVMETAQPQLATNWRWQLYLLRAYYDMYIRERLVYEEDLEVQANAVLADAPFRGANIAMNDAAAILDLATTAPVRADLRTRIVDLCDDLFNSIGLQTSVPLYGAYNWERGAILDFVDQPLNNRGWLESEFARIGGLPSESEKLAEISMLLNWENPGAGGSYNDLGNSTKEPDLLQQLPWVSDPGYVVSTQDEFIEIVGRETWRLSWLDQAQTLYGTPLEMQFTGLNPSAQYRVQVLYTGRFHATMSLTADSTYTIHGALAQPSPPQVLEYLIPMAATLDGALHLQWDLYGGRGCQVGEVWLVED